MENSRKSKSDLVERTACALRPVVPQDRSILLGLSGGMDSVVLLHLLHALAPRFSWCLSALHVHHGISPNADGWADFCSALCARHGIPLHIERVSIAALRGEHGIEAAARKLRHAAFLKRGCDFVALAHHADDQAETLLLQLLRGAGVKGAAAMPVFKPAAAHMHATLRPLLGVPRSVLLEYARQHALQWVEDESNSDGHYARNFLRHRVFPQLEQRFPAYRDTLSRSAAHFAEAGELLDDLARQDAPDIFPFPVGGGGARGEGLQLPVQTLRSLSHARAKNLLRYFLHAHGATLPHDAQLADMLRQVLEARANAAVCATFGAWQVHRYRGKVYVSPVLGAFARDLVLPWHGESELEWPASATRLIFSQTQGQGISLAKLRQAPITLRLRNGGETLRPHPKATTRSLKNLLQEHHIPPWRRERLPLLYCGEELACVVGVAVAADFQVSDSESGIVVA
ncbi:MAG: tRNA lysidine(34) synthetase TilS [Gallionellaceae bacterium]|nr:MAG: tRNA lysidine(34) synthetase TilS [Gallionellaceae bacterium]